MISPVAKGQDVLGSELGFRIGSLHRCVQMGHLVLGSFIALRRQPTLVLTFPAVRLSNVIDVGGLRHNTDSFRS
mgnify:FL=1